MHIAKIDSDKRIVTAVVSVASDGNGDPITDFDGDQIHIDDLELAFIKSFAKGGAKMGGSMHEEVGGAHVVQHMTFSKGEWEGLADLMGIPDMRGAWEVGIAKFFVRDDKLWEDVKSGALPELSIAGEAVREPVADAT